MKIFILILLAFSVASGFASLHCIGVETYDAISFWEKMPIKDLIMFSLYTVVLYFLCLPVLFYQKMRKWFLPEVLLFVLLCLWHALDPILQWRFMLPRTTQFRPDFSFYLLYFFLVYKSRLLNFFSTLSENKLVVSFSAIAFFFGSTFIYVDKLSYLGCVGEVYSGDTLSIFVPMFIWTITAWLCFSRTWRILVVSLPISFLWLYFGRAFSMFINKEPLLHFFNSFMASAEKNLLREYLLMVFVQLLFFASIRSWKHWRLNKGLKE